jgi:O-antigen/teichoic acid export membrane protein
MVARGLLPELRIIPRFSLNGLREIFGYSVFSFLTQIFHSMYRESGKLALGVALGPSAVAFLGTPDSIAYRLYMVIISGIETLLPKFSASKDQREVKSLVLGATWAGMTAAVTVLIPLAALMPDFLRLWINADFARESARVGQMVALSFIAPAGFAGMAVLLRGSGKPGYVTVTMALAGLCLFVGSIILIPNFGVLGAGCGYLLSSIPWLGGIYFGWLRIFETRNLLPLLRVLLLPLVVAALSFVAQTAVRNGFGEIGWASLFALGGSFAAGTAAVLLGLDWLAGEDSFAKQSMARIFKSGRFATLLRFIPAGKFY